MKKIASHLFALGAASALAIACAANTQAPGQSEPTGESPGADQKGSPEEAASTRLKTEGVPEQPCFYYQAVSSNNTFQDSCPGEIIASNTTYGSSACPYYGIEWNGTTANTSNQFAAYVAPAPIPESSCANTTLTVAFEGFDDTTNPAVEGVGGWSVIQTLTAPGTWNGLSCTFNGINTGPISISARVANPSPGYVPYYSAFAASVSSATATTNKGTTTTSYNEVSVNFVPASCVPTL
jgi:hypothetical protein